jgi:hypothetical protein
VSVADIIGNGVISICSSYKILRYYLSMYRKRPVLLLELFGPREHSLALFVWLTFK